MAKKIKLADLVFTVSDDNTLKIFEGKAKKAGTATEKLGKKTDQTTYATKKGINATANQTKNFANMARGISGSLVPAYATLAANVFALTAVFGFLKGAADYRILQEGQASYAAVTGTAYKTLTNTIIEATDSQIRYADAAQAAAIGTAAGLSPAQLGKIGEAAKLVSIALGRDVTDAFNRLVRGTTKAEPELLDALGIILRLDTALEKYATRLGKSKNSLSQFEKTQAITNDVLEQAEKKFGAIAEIMTPQTNQINKLNKSFDDLLNTFRTLIAGPAEGLATFFSQNVYAAAGALGLFALPIIQSILPAFDEWEKASVAKLAAHDAAVERSKKKIQAYGRLQEMNAAKAKARAQQAGVGLFQLAKGQAAGGAGTGLAQLQAGKTISDAQLRNLKAQATKGIGIFKDMDSKVKASWIKSMKEMNMSTKVNLVDKVGVQLKKTELLFRSTAVKIKAAWSTAMAGIQKVSRVTAGVVSKAFGFLTGISIAVLAFEGIKAGAEKLGFFTGKTDAADNALQKLLYTQRDLNKELDKMFEGRGALQKIDAGYDNIVKQAGQMFTSAAFMDTQDALDENNKIINQLEASGRLSKGITKIDPFTGERQGPETYMRSEEDHKYIKAIEARDKAAKEMRERNMKFAKEFSAFAKFVDEEGNVIEATSEAYYNFIKVQQEAGAGITTLENNMDKFNKAFFTFIGGSDSGLTFVQEIEKMAKAAEDALLATDFDETTEAGGKAKARASALRGRATSTAEYVRGNKMRELGLGSNNVNAQNITNQIYGATALGKRLQDINKLKATEIQLESAKAELLYMTQSLQFVTDETQAETISLNIAKKGREIQLLAAQKKGMENNLNLTRELGVTAVNTFENSMIKGIEGVIQGTMSVKDAFKSMAQSILVSLSQVLAKMMAMKVMTAMFGVTPMAEGGIIAMAKGGITGYRNGGIATEPTYLVGEGKHNEAVVPLPDGRSIPVNMKGNGGNNNIVINVDAGGNTNSTGGNAEQGKALGMAIQMAVMETIQREKRPGGVLS